MVASLGYLQNVTCYSSIAVNGRNNRTMPDFSIETNRARGFEPKRQVLPQLKWGAMTRA